MLNQCSFIGNLGADPEVRSFQSGGRVCNLRLAISERWKDKATGERKEKTEWISIAIFSDGLVGVAERYLRKGSKVFVQGKMATRKYTDQSGNDRYSTEVVLQGPGAVLTMLDSPRDGAATSRREPDGSQGHAASFADELDDQIPFLTMNSVR